MGKTNRARCLQFPQGGIHEQESSDAALYRELREEIGLNPEDVEVLACTKGWLKYRLPKRMVRTGNQPICIGQKQKWYLLRLIGPAKHIQFHRGPRPEFDDWRWVSYWYPLGQVVPFKRDVYRRALKELAPKVVGLQRSGNSEKHA
jgi:putative (di)nucleoside polyphosphate hydrolase